METTDRLSGQSKVGRQQCSGPGLLKREGDVGQEARKEKEPERSTDSNLSPSIGIATAPDIALRKQARKGSQRVGLLSTSTRNATASHPTAGNRTARHAAQSAVSTASTTRWHDRAAVSDLNRTSHGEALIELVVVEDELATLTTPVHDVEEDVNAALDALADAHGLDCKRRAVGQVENRHA